MSVRVRFAPSPTGYLHIGGARTALFNWLYARHTGGVFVLRVEDTDEARNSQEAVDVILEGLRWLGLDWDEGPTVGDRTGASLGDRGPYFQSQRGEIYRRRVEELKAKDLAYEHEGAVKFRMNREPITIPDLVCGEVVRKLTDREEAAPDFVIVRSDGKPVFHLVNVVDDIEMGITHVVRGEDHLSNTSKHIALFRAFGVEPPQFAHIPLILNGDGSKMSKRDEGASLNTYVEEGYTPEAVVNYLCLLGWSPKEDQEKMPIEAVIEKFDLPQILRSNARFDMDKLKWLNGEYLAEMQDDRYQRLATDALSKGGCDLKPFDENYVNAAIATTLGKVKMLSELPGYAGFYFQGVDEIEIDPEAAQKHLVPENLENTRRLREAFSQIDLFDAEAIQTTFKSVATDLGVKVRHLVHPVRLACTGSTIGPSLYHLIEILGKERVLQSLDRVIASMGE